MKTRFLRLLIALAVAGFTSGAMAVQFAVKDISNHVVTCDSTAPLLDKAPPGSCLVVPNGTLWVTATLEPGDDPSALDNLYLVFQNKGQNFQYRTESSFAQSERWQKISTNAATGPLPFIIPSFQRLPFETNQVGRQVSLGQFSSQKGARLFAGVRANNATGFATGADKEVFDVQ